MPDTIYKAYPFIFKSKGLIARYALDRPPDESYYLNLNGALERAETALSSRYGSIILNRDPQGSGTSNYLFPLPPVTLARLRSLNGQTFRYAALSDGSLYRRAGDLQGKFTEILSLAGSPPTYPLSGQPFTSLVNTTFQSAQPWLFMYDRKSMLKDNGVGTPSRIGILPPTMPVTSQAYAPRLNILQVFNTSAGMVATGGLSIGVTGTAFTTNGSGGTSQLGGSYERYTGSGQYFAPPDGMLASSSLADGAWRLKFQTNILTGQFDIEATNNAYTSPDTFTFPQLPTTIGTNTTGAISKTFGAIDLSAYDPADLITLVFAVTNPQNVQEIRVQFDVNNSSYGASYYTKTLIPASYQNYLNDPQLGGAVTASGSQKSQQVVIDQLLQGLGTRVRRLPRGSNDIPPILLDGGGGGGGGGGDGGGGLPPLQLPSGQTSWVCVHIQKGDFLPVGSAGQQGLDWSNITGWQIQVTTNTLGGASLLLNSLYVQGGGFEGSPVALTSGPSAIGGVGYDFRYTYFNANTQTESNPSSEQLFSVTPTNPGGVSTLIPLRQAVNLQGQYSPDFQVTHVRVYARGGLYGDNWYRADQFPNIPGGGTFSYKYTVPDSVLAEGVILNLENDVPVTSTLQNPISTTITGALNPSPANTNIPTLVTVNVAAAGTVFVTNQVVFIGTPTNLEETVVVTGGTGTFTCYIQLPHAAGEPLYSLALPAVPCYLAAIAYGQTWLAGDPNNPHYLYYTPNGYPENCPPQNYIPVGTPSDPIVAVMATRGVLFVATMSTWYQIFPGNPPYAQPTGSKHGLGGSFAWAIGENIIPYQAPDGIRVFRGTDGPLLTVIIEWLFRNNNLGPVVPLDLTKLNQVIAAYRNESIIFAYVGTDGAIHRLLWNNEFRRWRNDDRAVTAMFVEPDTNQLLYSVPMTIGGQSGWAICYDSYTQDWDDGGWVAGQLVKLGIPWTVQTTYKDQGSPHNPKQYNVLEIDCNPNGQSLSPLLLFDDNNGNVTPVVPSPAIFTGTKRDKFQFEINSGLGQQAYRVAIQLNGSIQGAPELYQANIYAAVLTDFRASYDTYWVKFNSDEEKVVKQGYFDYTSPQPIAVSLYADGNLAAPYYTFTLPANPTRLQSPVRVRFGGSRSLRMFRLVATSSGGFQLWSPVQADWKPLQVGKGYTRANLADVTPP